MKRISTDAEYLTDGTVTVDADGIPITISGKADQSVITGATHEVGRADAVSANRLVKLDKNGDLFIATNSIIKDSDPVNKVYVDRLVPIPAFAGTGSPEGRVTAPVGTIYTDTAATNGAIRWIKTSGTGNTGWRVEYGDTGWRSSDANFLATGSIMIRRINNDVYLKIGTGQFGLFTFRETSPAAEIILPLHFRPSGNEFMDVRYDNTKAVVGTVSIQSNGWFSPRMDAGYTDTSRNLQTSAIVYPTEQAWPSTLPGTPA